jgi:hypothetical protein
VGSELADLLVPHHSQGAGPRPGFGGRAADTHYGQATVLEWNPDTGENLIRYRGTEIRNMPSIAGLDGLVFRPGDQVATISWSPNGGAGVIFVLGRLVVPGTDAAVRSIEVLRTQLVQSIMGELVQQLLTSPEGEELAAFVIGQRVHSDSAEGSESTDSSSFGTLPGGPVVSDVNVGGTGRMLVFCTATIFAVGNFGPSSGGGRMNFQVTGASSHTPGDTNALTQNVTQHQTSSVQLTITSGKTRAFLVEGLSEGTHTVTARYRAQSNGQLVTFAGRNLTVIAF